jgi:hypothetical protein
MTPIAYQLLLKNPGTAPSANIKTPKILTDLQLSGAVKRADDAATARTDADGPL